MAPTGHALPDVTGPPREWLGSSKPYFALIALAMTVAPRHIRWLLALALTSACKESTAPAGEVSAVAVAAGIRATNASSQPVLYIVMEQGIMALIDVVPCEDIASCPNIPAGATVTIPWSAVTGYGPGHHDYVLFWHHPRPPLTERVTSGRVELSWP
jgi:hypothetical protein